MLQDGNALNDYKIEDGHTIHMVARPSDYEELRNQISRREETQQTTSSSSVRDSLQSLLALSSLIGDSNVSRPGADRNDPSPPEVSTSLEPIRQSLLTMHTLLSTMNPAQIESSTSQTTRKYFVGQWLDVKDTVNQWLEATIMQVDNEQGRIFVHYNGW